MKITDFENRFRPSHLEAVRGIAAWIVVFHHLSYAFVPAIIVSDLSLVPEGWLRLIAFSPLNLIVAGKFAVMVFFVLSGTVLSYKFFARINDPAQSTAILRSSAVRRYFRLAIPCLASVIMSWALLKSGLYATQETAVITGSSWLSSHFGFPPDCWIALRQGVYDIFFGPAILSGGGAYNSSLWTIGTELIGSFFVFAFLALFGSVRRRWLIYFVGALLFLKSYMLCFLLGIAFCDLYVQVNREKPRFHSWVWAEAALLIGLYLGSFRTSEAVGYGVFRFVEEFALVDTVKIIGASLVVFSVLFGGLARALLRHSLFGWLGRTSYAVYLLHILVICSLGCQLFLVCISSLSFPVSIGISSLGVILVVLFSAQLFYLWVDRPAIRLGHLVFQWLNPDLQPQLRASP